MFAGCWPTEGALSAATGHQTNLSLPRNQVLGFRGLAIFLFGPSSNTVRAQNPNTSLPLYYNQALRFCGHHFQKLGKMYTKEWSYSKSKM